MSAVSKTHFGPDQLPGYIVGSKAKGAVRVALRAAVCPCPDLGLLSPLAQVLVVQEWWGQAPAPALQLQRDLLPMSCSQQRGCRQRYLHMHADVRARRV